MTLKLSESEDSLSIINDIYDSDSEGKTLPFIVNIHHVSQFTGLPPGLLLLIHEFDETFYQYYERQVRIACRQAIVRMTPT